MLVSTLVSARRSPLQWLVLISPFFLWGTAMVAMKGTLNHTGPFFLAGLRLVPAGLLVVAASLLAGRSQPQTGRAWLWIGAFAIVDGALFQGFLAQGLSRTGAGLGSVMIDSQPLAVALLAAWLYAEHIGPIGWLGLVIGVIGIGLVGLPTAEIGQVLGFGSAEIGAGSIGLDLANLSHSIEALVTNLINSGAWWMLLAALSMATGTVMMRAVSRHADPIAATGWHMILGGLPLFGLSAGLESEPWQHLTLTDWGAIAYATVFGSAIAYGLFFYFASQGNLTSLSALTFLTPIFALGFGHWLLDESLSLVQAIGVALTLLSIYLVNQREIISDRLGRTWPGSIAPETPAPVAIAESSPDPESITPIDHRQPDTATR